MAVLREDTGEVLVLSPSATEIWQLCDGARSAGEITAILRERYPAAPDLAADVEATVATFVSRGFLIAAAPDGSAPST